MRDFIKRIGGRKYVSMILMVLMVTANDALGLNLEEQTIHQILALVLGWILGESIIDASSALRQPAPEPTPEPAPKPKPKPAPKAAKK